MARYLEEQAPGQYRQEIVGARARRWARLRGGQLTVQDAAPLFQVLQITGDASTAADLASATPQWQYYATMALAGMNEGQGVSAPVQSAQEAARSGKTQNSFTLQMLAQVAAQQPDAASALLEQAARTRFRTEPG